MSKALEHLIQNFANADTGKVQEEKYQNIAYINIGSILPYTDAETGATEDVFVGLPYGLGINQSYLKKQKVNTKSVKLNNINTVTNFYVQELTKLIEQVGQGNEILFSKLPKDHVFYMPEGGLQLQLLVVGENNVPDDANNQMLTELIGK